MSPQEALRAAAGQTWSDRRILFVYYLANFVTAAVLIAPFATALAALLGHSLESDREFPTLDLSWIVESLRATNFVPLRIAPVLFGLVGLLYVLLNTFLAGGVLASFAKQGNSFFANCARFFPRFLRLLLWSAPFYALVLALNGSLQVMAQKFAKNSMEEYPWIIAGWARVGLILALLLLVNLLFDYARISIVVNDRRSAFASIIASFRFFAGNAWGALAIFLACQVLGLTFLLAYHLITEVTPQSSMTMLILVFLIRQVYTLSRAWTRLLGWSAAVQFYDSRNSTIVAPVPPSDWVAE